MIFLYDVAGYLILGLIILWIMQFVLPGKKLHCRNCKERRLNIEHKTEQLVKKTPEVLLLQKLFTILLLQFKYFLFFLPILCNCVVFLQCSNWAYCLAVLRLLMWAAVQMPCLLFYICVLKHVVHMESLLDLPFVTLQFPSDLAGFEIAEDRSVTLYCTGPGIGLSDKCRLQSQQSDVMVKAGLFLETKEHYSCFFLFQMLTCIHLKLNTR